MLNSPEPSKIDQRAALWVMKQQQGRLSPRQERAFARWRESDPRHAQAARKALQAWQASASLCDDPELAMPERPAPKRFRPPLSWPWLNPRHWQWPQAVTLVLVLGVSSLWFTQTHWLMPLQADHYAGTGEILDFTLEDGSRVQLASESAINVDYSSDGRRVELVQGEGIFSPSPVNEQDPRPFIVKTAGAEIKALGTRYLVRKENSGAGLVAVLEHRISVKFDRPPDTGMAYRQVKRAQIVRFNQQTGVEPVDLNIANVTGWSRGMLVFRRAPLAEVTRQLSRYGAGRIFIASEELAERPVSAVFALENIDSATESLGRALGAELIRLPGATVIYSTKNKKPHKDNKTIYLNRDGASSYLNANAEHST
ncbi:MAG: FecR family protein [Marinobacter sp.]